MREPTPSELALIHSRLGPDARRFAYTVGGRSGWGYSAALPLPPIAADIHAYYAAKSQGLAAIAADTALRAADIRHFAAEGGNVVCALPGLPPLDVIAWARVGTHNQATDWPVVQALVRDTIGRLPLDVVLASAAGLDLRTPEPIPVDLARAWDRLLLDRMEAGEVHWSDSYTFMHDRLKGPRDPGADPRGGGAVAAFIVATRSLRFWWD